uniref:Hypothetical p60 protein n=1 Tax=Anticarsia gemmatalis nuclear polyhedrosis virus TaxID=31507 RepID=Q9EEF8_NPVAG|nr:hypothetical p60 protein [Anticarsia gemmatalis nucleopolyhedrovirus]
MDRQYQSVKSYLNNNAHNAIDADAFFQLVAGPEAHNLKRNLFGRTVKLNRAALLDLLKLAENIYTDTAYMQVNTIESSRHFATLMRMRNLLLNVQDEHIRNVLASIVARVENLLRSDAVNDVEITVLSGDFYEEYPNTWHVNTFRPTRCRCRPHQLRLYLKQRKRLWCLHLHPLKRLQYLHFSLHKHLHPLNRLQHFHPLNRLQHLHLNQRLQHLHLSPRKHRHRLKRLQRLYLLYPLKHFYLSPHQHLHPLRHLHRHLWHPHLLLQNRRNPRVRFQLQKVRCLAARLTNLNTLLELALMDKPKTSVPPKPPHLSKANSMFVGDKIAPPFGTNTPPPPNATSPQVGVSMPPPPVAPPPNVMPPASAASAAKHAAAKHAAATAPPLDDLLLDAIVSEPRKDAIDRSALFDEIKMGATLKKVEPVKPPLDPRVDMLNQIKTGATLRKTGRLENENLGKPIKAPPAGILGVLYNTLGERRGAHGRCRKNPIYLANLAAVLTMTLIQKRLANGFTICSAPL